MDGCQKCGLGKQVSVRVVHSLLPKHAKVMFIAEAPGLKENDTGVPLIGPSGQLFNECLKEAGFRREDVALANVVACQPPGNRNPTTKEAGACYEFLEKEINLVKPLALVLLGGIALKQILPGIGGITSARGHWYHHATFNCMIMPTFHPAFILRYMPERPKLVSDIKLVKEFIDKGEVTEQNHIETQYFTIETEEQLDWLVDILNREPEWSCDTETTGLNPREAEIFIITFSWQEGIAALIDTRLFENTEVLWAKVKSVLENGSKKIFQNGSFDIQCFWTYGISVANFAYDTMLMHYCLNENAPSGHGLEVLAQDYTDLGGYDLPLARYVEQNKIDNYKNIPPAIIRPYAVQDADVTYRSYMRMKGLIAEEKLDFVHDNIMIPTAKLLAYTEYNGVSIDKEHLFKTIKEYEKTMASQLDILMSVKQIKAYESIKQKEVVDVLRSHWKNSKTLKKTYPIFDSYLEVRKQKNPQSIAFSFNVNSPLQLKELLIDHMKMPIIKRTKKKNACIDEEVLNIYGESNDFCNSLASYRSLSHLKSTFLDGIVNRMTDDNKIHTNYLLHSTVTGRPSSRDPNLNNIPGTSTAEAIKDIFCGDYNEATQSRDWLVEADLGQAEFRIWICYSKDPQAIRDLNVGIDIHKLIAATAYHGITLPDGDITYEQFLKITEKVTKEERKGTKFVIFGLMYGRGAASVAKQLNLSIEQAQYIIDRFFGRYPKARKWLLSAIGTARQTGYITNLFGRRRRLLDINKRGDITSDNKRAEAERQATNAPIQSAASDLVFLAAGRIIQFLWENNYSSRLVLTVYDSVVFNVPDDELETVVKLIGHEMCNHPYDFIIVPMTADIKIGTHWGSLTEIDISKPWNEEYQRVRSKILETDKKFVF